MSRKGKTRGPKGGTKHTPGRGHDRKSRPQKVKDSVRRRQRRSAEREALRVEKRGEWAALTPKQQRLLRPDFEEWLGEND